MVESYPHRSRRGPQGSRFAFRPGFCQHPANERAAEVQCQSTSRRRERDDETRADRCLDDAGRGVTRPARLVLADPGADPVDDRCHQHEGHLCHRLHRQRHFPAGLCPPPARRPCLFPAEPAGAAGRHRLVVGTRCRRRPLHRPPVCRPGSHRARQSAGPHVADDRGGLHPDGAAGDAGQPATHAAAGPPAGRPTALARCSIPDDGRIRLPHGHHPDAAGGRANRCFAAAWHAGLASPSCKSR